MFFRETVCDIKGIGVTFLVAYDLAGAIELAKKVEFDVILLDLGFPGCLGIETLSRMTKEVDSTPIVVFTGSQRQGSGVGAVQGGAQDLFVKVFVSGDILEKTMLYATRRFTYELIRQELEQARVKLAKIAKTKSRFLLNVSRELSTPLTTKMGDL
ncbi:MAG: DNA-binding response OmpR family regulator [Candidatus Azotimanducaceae bacterium]|jgi:DNA-binding response OmpR family regulator